MLFKDIIGQNELKAKLIQTVKEGRISHAQFFLGKSGYSTLPLAVAYAQYVCCENKDEDDSCGVCPSCHKYQKLIHPDLHFVFPVNSTKSISSDKKPISDYFINDWRQLLSTNPYFTEQDWYETIGIDNKQGNISANEADRIISKLNLKPYEAEYKVMIIWLPERLNVTSANRLLKLIEEPPTNTLFLLVSENSGQVLKTIYSRTQLIKLPPIEEPEIVKALLGKGIPDKDAHAAARLAQGNYRQAMQILANRDSENEYFSAFVMLMRYSYSNDVITLLEWAEDMAGWGRERQKAFLSYAESILRENFMLNLKIEDTVYLGFNEYDWAQKFAPFINQKNVYELYKQFNHCIGHIGQNGNAKIIFSDLVLKTVKLIN
ncbi:MAG: DNA polymerase III subunit delta [Prevotellaceae bacterium]|jgi:DNA polymerase-3 subunit delta'|nr:DNA polymerase III subunit delta [Prevotellaceae bacterium]